MTKFLKAGRTAWQLLAYSPSGEKTTGTGPYPTVIEVGWNSGTKWRTYGSRTDHHGLFMAQLLAGNSLTKMADSRPEFHSLY
jgi:hypothetical protein